MYVSFRGDGHCFSDNLCIYLNMAQFYVWNLLAREVFDPGLWLSSTEADWIENTADRDVATLLAV